MIASLIRLPAAVCFFAGLTFLVDARTDMTSPTAERSANSDAGLPPLPGASGSGGSGGTYGALPEDAALILRHLQCDVGAPGRVKISRITAENGKVDFMATDRSGSNFRYWIRSFAGTGGTTGYLTQLNGCPAWTNGMRAYIARDGGMPQDVTAQILARGGFPDHAAMKKYTDQEASELFAVITQLDRVPTLRWIAETEPGQGLKKDKRTFGRRNYVHGGFLVWADDHFEVRQKVPAALWPCGHPKSLQCIDDPFVEGR